MSSFPYEYAFPLATFSTTTEQMLLDQLPAANLKLVFSSQVKTFFQFNAPLGSLATSVSDKYINEKSLLLLSFSRPLSSIIPRDGAY